MTPKRVLSVVLAVSLAGGPVAPGAEIEKREVRVAVPIANVRAEPSVQSRVLQQVRRGDVLRVIEGSGDWYLIAAPGMQPGYVSKTVVEAATPEPIPKPAPAPVVPVAPRASTTPEIAHDPLKCVLPEINPVVFADVTAPAQVQKSRVYFKAHQFPDWYYIDMKAPSRPHYLALLPQPLPETQIVDYYIHALDTTLQTSRTEQYEPTVLKGGCQRDERATRVDPQEANQIVIGGTREGQPPIPPGFSKVGILAFVTVAGALITGAALQAPAAAASAATGAATSAPTRPATSTAPSAVPRAATNATASSTSGAPATATTTRAAPTATASPTAGAAPGVAKTATPVPNTAASPTTSGAPAAATTTSAAAGGGGASPAQLAQQPGYVDAEQQQPDCMIARGYPRLRTCFHRNVAAGRIVFRIDNQSLRRGPWYQVPMFKNPQTVSCYQGVLPQPKWIRDGSQVSYSFVGTESDATQLRSGVFESLIVGKQSACTRGRQQVADTDNQGPLQVSLEPGEVGSAFPEGFEAPLTQIAGSGARSGSIGGGNPTATIVIVSAAVLALGGVGLYAWKYCKDHPEAGGCGGSGSSSSGGGTTTSCSNRSCVYSSWSDSCDCAGSAYGGTCGTIGPLADGKSCYSQAVCVEGHVCVNGTCRSSCPP